MRENTVDTEALKVVFMEYQCHGVVELIDHLLEPEMEGVTEIGSSTIGLSEILNEIWLDPQAQMAAAWFRTHSLYIGSRDGSVTPLEWLEELSQVFGSVSDPARKRFSQICHEFVAIGKATVTGIEIYRKDGDLFYIPGSEYIRGKHYTNEELEKYRVEKSVLFPESQEKVSIEDWLTEVRGEKSTKH